jgi:hypothetical protein
MIKHTHIRGTRVGRKVEIYVTNLANKPSPYTFIKTLLNLKE